MGWRQNAKEAIRAYPLLKRQAAALHAMPVTPCYAALPGAHEASRTTEDAALRQLPSGEQRQLDAVSLAIQTTLRYRNGALRLQIVDLVYWKRTHTLSGAAMERCVSIGTARVWHNGFVELVDAYLRIL